MLQDQADREARMVGAEPEIADPIPAEAQAQFTSAGVNEGGAVVHARIAGIHEGEPHLSAGELERRRKGKGIMIHEGQEASQGARHAARTLRATEYNSGSDSWDPINAGPHLEKADSLASKDADSRAKGEEGNAAGEQQKHLLLNEEDVDMGGECGGVERKERHGKEGMKEGKVGSGELEVKKEDTKGRMVKNQEGGGGDRYFGRQQRGGAEGEGDNDRRKRRYQCFGTPGIPEDRRVQSVEHSSSNLAVREAANGGFGS